MFSYLDTGELDPAIEIKAHLEFLGATVTPLDRDSVEPLTFNFNVEYLDHYYSVLSVDGDVTVYVSHEPQITADDEAYELTGDTLRDWESMSLNSHLESVATLFEWIGEGATAETPADWARI